MPVDFFSQADNKDRKAGNSTYCHVQVVIKWLTPEVKIVDWN